jgi:hypothetical protein
MSETVLKVHGIEFIHRRKSDIWVACLGPDWFVHVYKPTGCSWVAKKPRALEPIAHAKTMSDCILKVKQYYEARKAKQKEKLSLIIRDL